MNDFKKLSDSEVFSRDYTDLPKETEDEIAARLEKIMIRQRKARGIVKEEEPKDETPVEV